MSVLERIKMNREWDANMKTPEAPHTIEEAVDLFLKHLALPLEEVLLFDVFVKVDPHPYCITLEFFKDAENKQGIGKLEYRPCYPDPNAFPAVNVCPYMHGGIDRYGNLVSLHRVESWFADMIHRNGIPERTEANSVILEDGIFKDKFFNWLRKRDAETQVKSSTKKGKFISWIFPRK